MSFENKLLAVVLGVFAAMILGLWLTMPTEANIQACVKATNWTAERCLFELTK